MADDLANLTFTNWEEKPYQSSGSTWLSDPCPSGWRLPAPAELTALKDCNLGRWVNEGTYAGKWFGNALLLPAAGDRDPALSGNLVSFGIAGWYWANSAVGRFGYDLGFDETLSQTYGNGYHDRSLGFSLRCVAN
jgi:hypothetical protein